MVCVFLNEEKKPNYILRRERQLRGWSQQKMAELIGTSEDVISRWERGKRRPSPFFQEKMCVLSGKNAEELGFIQPHLPQPSTIITLVPDINQAVNERLDQSEGIVNLSWEAWFASRPKHAKREITKLLSDLEKMIYMPLSSIQVLRTKELIIRCHGLIGTMYLDALQENVAFYHYTQALEDPRGKYVCLLYVLKEPLNSEALIKAGDDASHVVVCATMRRWGVW